MNYGPLQITVHATTAWSQRSCSFDQPVRTGDVINVLSRPLARPVSCRPVENRDVWLTGWVKPMAIVRPEGVFSLKFPITPPVFEPITFRPVMQCRNQWHHRVPPAFLTFPYIAPFPSWLSCQMYTNTVHNFYIFYFIELQLVKFMICRGSNAEVVLNDAFARMQTWLILSRRS